MKPQKWVQPSLTAGTTAAQAFVANVAAAAEQIDANAAGLLASRNPEYLHQMRVGIRRMRSTLRAFRCLARRRQAAVFDTELRSTLRILGVARDWDAFTQSRFSGALRRAARRPRLEAQRKARQAVLRKGVQSLPGRVLDWAGSEPWRKSADPKELIGSFGARALKRLHADLSRSADGIDWTDAERRHRVRIRVKRLRYGLDCFVGGFAPATVDRFGHRLHALQEVLGNLNDFRVQRSLLRQLEILRPSLPASRTESLLASRERSLTGQAAVAWSKVGARPRRWRREAARARG